MKDAATGKAARPHHRTDWNRVRTMSDDALHRAVVADPEVLPTDEAFWENAKLVTRPRKQPVTMRLDADMLAWFRQDPGYQTRINAILRTYMQAQMRKTRDRTRADPAL